MANQGNTRYWIAGSLFVEATREERPACESGIPAEWINTFQTPSRELHILAPAPIMIRDPNGDVETLIWYDEKTLSPSLHPSTPLETWVVEETNPAITDDIIQVIRLCLYDIPRILSSNKKPDLRRRLVERIKNDRRFRLAIARHVLNTSEDKVLGTRNMTRLLKNSRGYRTLQKDRGSVQKRANGSRRDPLDETANIDEAKGEYRSGSARKHDSVSDYQTGNIPTDLPTTTNKTNVDEKQRDDSTAGKEVRGEADTIDAQERSGEPHGELNETLADGAVPTGINDQTKKPEDSSRSNQTSQRDLSKNSHDESSGKKPTSAERLEVAREFYSRLQAVEPELPEFQELIKAKKEAVIERLIKRGKDPTSDPQEIAPKVLNHLQEEGLAA